LLNQLVTLDSPINFAPMNRKIIIISSIVTLAVVTLIGIQVYWIQNAINLKEANFRRSVDEAITRVIYKLERIEIAKQLKKNQKGSMLLRSMDSLNLLMYDQMLVSQEKIFKKTLKSQLKILNETHAKTREQAAKDHPSKGDSNMITITDNQQGDNIRRGSEVKTNEDWAKKDSLLAPEFMPSHRTREIFDQQSSLLNQIFKDIFTHSSPQAIEKRISAGMLDTLISAELSAKSINIEFEFGVFSSSLNRIKLEKTGKYHDKLMRKGYSFALFPNNMFSSPDYLLLYFPKISRFILFQMWGMLAVSLALVLVIIAAFIYSITTIIRQKKISEMKNDFINNMTHEFKTPISTVSLACQALTDNDVQKSDELYRNYINIISDENKRLGVMAEKILQTAILEKGKLNARMESLNINEIIAEVIKNIGIQIEIRDGVIETRLDAEQYVINADRIHISNVIYNLLDNANKYTRRKPHILVSTENTPGGILILVQDNGIGIPKTYQKKVFDKLFRVPTGDIHNVKGFGLGLSYVKFVVEKHMGTITVESEPNKGSTFRIFLPY